MQSIATTTCHEEPFSGSACRFTVRFSNARRGFSFARAANCPATQLLRPFQTSQLKLCFRSPPTQSFFSPYARSMGTFVFYPRAHREIERFTIPFFFHSLIYWGVPLYFHGNVTGLICYGFVGPPLEIASCA